MSPVLILLSAIWSGVVCISAGFLMLRWLKVPLRRGERIPLSFVTGSAALSTIVFLLLTMWLARPWVLAGVGLVIVTAAIWFRAWHGVEETAEPQPLPSWWRWVFAGALLFYGTYTFFYAMAPEASPDGSSYHLGVVGRYFRAGGFAWYTDNMYANLPMGIEMLFLYAYAFGRHSAAALLHWQFLVSMPILLLAIGRRFGSPKTGAIAGLIAFMTPVIMIDGATAYVDTAAATVVVAMFLALVAWEGTRSRTWLPVIGILAGFSYCSKLTAAPAVIFAVLYVAVTLLRRREWEWRQITTVVVIAAALIAPWLIKNTLMVGNPFSPFLNRYFPNPNVRISFEDDYRQQYKTYYGKITDWKQIPLEVTVKGGTLNGLVGPLFLFAPAALLALRWPLGRRAWIAALFMASTFSGNIGTRFLISAVPFVALAMAQLFDRWRVGLLAVAFQAMIAWPDAMQAYADQYAWRLDRFRWTQAWRLESEDTFLARMVDGYRMSRLADALVPADRHIFTYGGIAEAYTTRDVTIAYESGRANAAGEVLAGGIALDMDSAQALTYKFPNRNMTRVRIVQTATTKNIWSLTEVRLQNFAGNEYSRQPWWRVKASPNPWDIAWAFDNCPVTRWKAWDRSTPGEFVEVDFVKPVDIGGVRLEMSTDQPETRMRIEGLLPDGKWVMLSDKPELSRIDPPQNIRKIAIDDLKRMGYTHLIVANGEFLAKDVFAKESDWGLTRLADAGNARLYRMD